MKNKISYKKSLHYIRKSAQFRQDFIDFIAIFTIVFGFVVALIVFGTGK
jgi:hypothetical protein